MRLLFTGGGGAGSEPLYALLRDRYDVHFGDANPDVKPPSIPVDRWHVLPRANRKGFIDDVVDLCRSLSVDVLIPGVDEELRLLAMARDWNALPCHVLLPSTEFIGTHLDKLTSMKTLQRAGIPVPQTWRRAIVKPREGRGSRNVTRIGHADGSIVQEYLEGQEYTVTMVADRSQRIRAVVPVKVQEKKGITLRAHTDGNQSVIEACRKIHDVAPTSGLYNIQGIETADGFKPFEINPRISTTTCLAMAAGVDVIGLALDHALSGRELAQFGQVSLQRSWQTVFA